jgi:Zn-finger nucleic acid-binding protein
MYCPECNVKMIKEKRAHWSGIYLWFICPKCNFEVLMDEEL